MSTRILLIVDPSVPQGELHLGGTVVLGAVTDAELGWAVLAKPLRVRSTQLALNHEKRLGGKGYDVRRLRNGRLTRI